MIVQKQERRRRKKKTCTERNAVCRASDDGGELGSLVVVESKKE